MYQGGKAAFLAKHGKGGPVNVTPPTISGSRGGTLTATPGVWTGATSVSRQWYSDGVATGVTTLTYSDTDTSTSLEYRETALPGNVTARAYDGASATAADYSQDFNSAADGTRFADSYNTTNLTTFAATATPHLGDGWVFTGYQETGDTDVTGNAQQLRIYNGKLQQTYHVNQGGNSAFLRPFASAGGIFDFELCFTLDGSKEARYLIFSPVWSSIGGGLTSGIIVEIIAQGTGTHKFSLMKYDTTGIAVNIDVGSFNPSGDVFRVKLDDTAKNVKFFLNGNAVGNSSGYDVTAALPTLVAKHGFLAAYGADPIAGQNLFNSITYNQLQSNSASAAINPQASGAPGKKQVDVSATIGVSGATGAQFKVETAAGAFIQGWTAMSYAAGSATATYVIPDFAYEGQQLRILVRNVGGTVKTAAAMTPVNGYALQQSMRIAVNEAPLSYFEGQFGARDLFMPVAMATGNGGDNPFYAAPVAGGSSHDFGITAIGDTLDNYGHWAETYNPAQNYPASTSSDAYYRCVLNGVQWIRTANVVRSGVAPDPADPNGTVSGWKRGGYALASVFGRKVDGWPSQLPADANLTISFPLPTYIPNGKAYPVTIAAKTEPIARFLASDTSYVTVTDPDVSGNFTITLLQDGTKSIRIDRSRTASISSAFFMSGIPSWETGSPAADVGVPYISAVKKADLTPFYGYRMMKAAPIERQGGTPTYTFTGAANVEADGSTKSWKYQCDVANQMGAKVIKVAVPDNADDAWITKFAQFLLANLNSTIEVRPAWSNEMWNDGSYQNASDMDAKAATAGISRQQYYARQTNRVVSLFKAAFGASASRIKGVVEWQSVAGTSEFQSILDFENCYQNVGVVSIAPYFGGGIGSTGIIGYYATASTAMKNAVTANDQAAFNAATDTLARTAITDAVNAMVTIYSWLPTYSVSKGLNKNAIQMESYEAGQHFIVDQSNWDAGLGAGMGARAVSMMATYKRSATFATTMGVYLDTMATKCPHTMFFFDYMGRINYQGWGMMDGEGYTAQEPYATIKTKALVYNA
jgi:hypothetical protein